MSTITKEFTKEQLIEHLKKQMKQRELHIASPATDRGFREYLELEIATNEIALASLEAEPVAHIIQDKADRKEGNRGQLSFKSVEQYHEKDINEHELTATPLYTAPPAPAVDADDNFYSWFGREWHEHYQQNQYTTAAKQMLGVMAESAWKAGHCAAMLQGAEPVTTAYKLPPHIYRELVNRLHDTAAEYQGCQQLREQLSRTLQEVIQPASPQQEVK